MRLEKKKGCAIPAFNVYNLETVLGVLNAAQETGAPVIFQMYSRLFDTQEARYVAPAIMEAIDTLKTPAAFHLDHGAGEPEVMRALRYGATGVMIDASVNPLEENIAQTRRVVELAGAVGVGVEGELGHVGTTKDEVMAAFTEVDEAVRYVDETGVTALAIMVELHMENINRLLFLELTGSVKSMQLLKHIWYFMAAPVFQMIRSRRLLRLVSAKLISEQMYAAHF